MDNGLRYGAVTRMLHWAIAGLLLWQLGGVAAGILLGETALTDSWGSTHKGVGFLILVVAVVRAGWGFFNLSLRPALHAGLVGKLAVAGHLALYVLTLAVPIIGLIRQYGSGRPFDVFGLTLMKGSHERIEWMTRLGGDWHGELGWVLAAMIVLHIVMAMVHQFVWKDGTLTRMV